MKNNFKLCLIQVNVGQAVLMAPLNLLALGSYLVAKKVLRPDQIKIINSLTTDDTLQQLAEYKPDMIGISSVTLTYPDATDLAAKIKKTLKAVVVVGGHHITGIPEDLKKIFDVGVIGEGEGTLADLVSLVKKNQILEPSLLKKIPNLVYRNSKGEIEVNSSRPLLKPEEIPKNNWSLLEPEQVTYFDVVYQNNKAKVVKCAQIFSARGCPYQCAFCARQVIWKEGNGFRLFPMERIIEEIEYLYNKYNISGLDVLDDTFAVSKQRIKDLIKNLKLKKLLGKIVFPLVFVRANLIDEELVLLLKELGVLSVYMGIESGSPRILKYLKNGSLTVKQVKKATLLFSKNGVWIRGSFMFFTPGETKNDLDKSYNLVRWFADQKNVRMVNVFLTVPFPGTRLWNDFVVNKKVDIESINWKSSRYVISNPNLSVARKVFFSDAFTPKEIDYYWSRVYSISKEIDKKTESLPGWRESREESGWKNMVFFEKMERRQTWKRRWYKLAHHPMAAFSRFFHLSVW